MKFKIIRSTEAWDEGLNLDELVNKFLAEHSTAKIINCDTDQGETYVYISYEDNIYKK